MNRNLKTNFTTIKCSEYVCERERESVCMCINKYKIKNLLMFRNSCPVIRATNGRLIGLTFCLHKH